MKSAIKVIAFADLMFILCLVFAGLAEGVASEIIYYCAFALPILMLYSYMRSKKANPHSGVSLTISKSKLISSGLLVFPAVGITALLAFLTTLLMGAFGFSQSVIEPMPIYLALLVHAFVPALLEEILFRFFPIKLMAAHSERLAILLSAAAFSLCHTDLFKIPYAFFAGLVFGYITLHSGSIIPTFIIHFINNALSVTVMLYPEISLWIYIALGVLALVSAVLIFFTRKNYRDIARILKKGEDEAFTLSALALVMLSLFVAITSLF